uniref:(northern house mosquito) hypothetical protein n=1 Tax=Culex pipiens TaxID=7175 RepID=A0A8D8CH58_CULPI
MHLSWETLARSQPINSNTACVVGSSSCLSPDSILAPGLTTTCRLASSVDRCQYRDVISIAKSADCTNRLSQSFAALSTLVYSWDTKESAFVPINHQSPSVPPSTPCTQSRT